MIDAEDAVNGRVQAFPDIRQANYLGTFQITPNYPNYPQYGSELPADNVDGVHDAVVQVDGQCVFYGLGLDG